jgi:hypothetical protein
MSERWEATLWAFEEQNCAAPPDPGTMLFSEVLPSRATTVPRRSLPSPSGARD